jgi:hypothetical protein
VADVVVAAALRHTGRHREDGLGAIEGLHLGLLVHAEHDGAFGWVQVQRDDVADLVDEQRVLGQLEGVLPARA